MRTAARSLWAEPRAPAPPARVWRDWVLVAVLVPTALLEGLLREDLAWPAVAIVVALVAISTLLWRRTRPLLAVAVAFGSIGAAAVAELLWADEPVGLYTSICVLLLPYALFRWGAGREAAIGLAIILACCVVGIAADDTGVVDAVAGTVFLLFPAALGASVRYRAELPAPRDRSGQAPGAPAAGARAARHGRPPCLGHRHPGPGRTDRRSRPP